MTSDDLELLDTWQGFPGEHRLAGCLEATLAGPDYKARYKELATVLGYSRPEIINQWINHDTIIPLRHLPKISAFTGIHLSVLVTLWIATYAADDDEADLISRSIAPRITSGEFAIIETARAIYDEAASERSVP